MILDLKPMLLFILVRVIVYLYIFWIKFCLEIFQLIRPQSFEKFKPLFKFLLPEFLGK